jgi:hypothetical protein
LRPGDPIGLNNMCAAGTARIFGLGPDGLEPLKPTRVALAGRVGEPEPSEPPT